MRPTCLTKFSARALSLALGAAVLVAALPARAEDDVPFDTKIFNSILGGIGLRKDTPDINYQERAPLVIPPGRALPPPEKPGAMIANNPAWPNDPDVRRLKEEAEKARNRPISAGEQQLEAERRLRPDELDPPKARNARRTASSPVTSQTTTYGYSERLSPSQLGYTGGLFSNIFGGSENESAKFTGEPPRVTLTEPPPGYQTPSPDQPYGIGKEKLTAPSAEEAQAKRPISGL